MIAINIPSKCTSIDPTAFSGCTSLNKITVGTGSGFFRYNEDGSLVDKAETTIYMIKEDATSVTISSSRLEVDGDKDTRMLYKDNTTVLANQRGVLHSKIHPSAITIASKAGFLVPALKSSTTVIAPI